MFILTPLVYFTLFTAQAQALQRRAPSRIAVTNHVLPLVAIPHSHPVAPSTRYLHKRRSVLTNNLSVLNSPPPNATSLRPVKQNNNNVADIQQDLSTLGGRVYMAEISLADNNFTLVIDTGSSDTWVASSAFQCVDPLSFVVVPQATCKFGPLYDVQTSSSWRPIQGHNFSTRYVSGEFLTGELGTEMFGLGGGDRGKGMELVFRQTIGVIDQGWWFGDTVSSGLMGLAYPLLASGSQELNYTSVIFTLFENGTIPPIFSLALVRPATAAPTFGGLLAIGGIPDIPHENNWVTTPILHTTLDPESSYSFYSINIDGFNIIPPTPVSSPIIPRPLLPPRPRIDFSKTRLSVILDSGTSLLTLPSQLTTYVASLFIPPATYDPVLDWYVVPCNASAPRVGVIIKGTTFWIHRDDLMNRGPGNVGVAWQGTWAQWAGRDCVVSMQKLPETTQGTTGSVMSVLGDSWLRGVVVVFDLGAEVIRVAGRGV